MNIRDGFLGTIGNTPLIRLKRASEETDGTILGKAEFLNPGGSVKDRAALGSSGMPKSAALCVLVALLSREQPGIRGSALLLSAMRLDTAP